MLLIRNAISTGSVNGTVGSLFQSKDKKNDRANAERTLMQGLFDAEKCSQRKSWREPGLWGARLSAATICKKQHITVDPHKKLTRRILENGINLFKHKALRRSRLVRKTNILMRKFNRRCKSKIKSMQDPRLELH